MTAAEEGESVTSFMEEALRAALARRAGTAPGASRYRVGATGSGGLRPGVDLTDAAALLDRTEGR